MMFSQLCSGSEHWTGLSTQSLITLEDIINMEDEGRSIRVLKQLLGYLLFIPRHGNNRD